MPHHLLTTVLLAASLAAGAAQSEASGPVGAAGATLGPPSRMVVSSDPVAWRPPVRPVVVVRKFDPPDQPWLPGHRGIDLRATEGQVVRAAGEGRVTFAADLAGRGVVVVDHGSLRTTYEPVDADVLVGESLSAGEPIGVIGTGSGHCGSGRCLHFGVRRGRTYLDPILLLGKARTRLVPW